MCCECCGCARARVRACVVLCVACIQARSRKRARSMLSHGSRARRSSSIPQRMPSAALHLPRAWTWYLQRNTQRATRCTMRSHCGLIAECGLQHATHCVCCSSRGHTHVPLRGSSPPFPSRHLIPAFFPEKMPPRPGSYSPLRSLLLWVQHTGLRLAECPKFPVTLSDCDFE